MSSSELIDAIFNDVSERYLDVEWLPSRAILVTTNSRMKTTNYKIIGRFPGRSQTFLSADSVVCDNPDDQKAMELKYPTELLNSIETGSSQPEHEIKLKKGFVVMLLRNIRQNCGHVNGTRYVVHNMTKNLLFLRAVSGTCKGSSILLPRMNCIPGKDDFPILGFRRCQFPVRVCFTMTINKAPGQSVPGKLGLDLCSTCFAHSQLYVALSRATYPGNVYVCTDNGQKKTKNVVYPEVLSVNATKVAQRVMSSKQPVDVVSELQFEDIIAKISIPHALGESDVLELDEHCENGSEIDHAELSHHWK